MSEKKSIVIVHDQYYQFVHTKDMTNKEMKKLVKQFISSEKEITSGKFYNLDVSNTSSKDCCWCKKMSSKEVRHVKNDDCDTVLIVDGVHYTCGYAIEVNYRKKIQNKIRDKIKNEMPFYGEYEITYKDESFYFTCKRMSEHEIKLFDLGI